MGVGDGELYAALPHRLGNLFGVLVGQGQHFLGEDVFARLGGRQQDVPVLVGGGSHLHPLDGGVGPNGVQVRLEGHSQLFSHSLAPFLVVVPQAAQLSLGVFLDGFRVLLGVDVPRPYSCNFHGIVLPKEKIFPPIP